MISGILAGWLLLALTTPSSASERLELDELLAAIADTGTAELRFKETRTSDLLDEELVVRGTLHRDDAGRLIRRTTEPTAELQILSDRHVEIRQTGGERQRFSLRRAPELAVLRSGLLGLLSGDRAALEQDFEVAFEPGNADCWQLILKPRDRTGEMPVEHLTISGQNHRIDGFTLSLTDGETIHTVIDRNP